MALWVKLEVLERVTTREEGLVWEEKGVIMKKWMLTVGSFMVGRMVYLVVEEEERLYVVAMKEEKEPVPVIAIVGAWLLD